MNTLENKNILITGATRGIGNKLATHFASQGANIVLLASNEESLNKTYDGLVSINPKGKHLIICCDLSNLDTSHYDEIKLNIDENYDALHGLVLNAAILGKMSALSDYDLETWNKVMNVNLTSQFMLAKTMLPILTNSQKARIIFTSSGVADYGKAFWGAYSVSKFAVRGLAEFPLGRSGKSDTRLPAWDVLDSRHESSRCARRSRARIRTCGFGIRNLP